MSGKGGSLVSKLGYQATQSVRTPGNPLVQAVLGTGPGAGGVVRLTVASTAAMTTGQQGLVQGVTGTTEANGTWILTVIDATHVDLQATTYVHAFTGGGTITINFMATVPGGLVSLVAANFDLPDTYTLQFNLTTGNVLPIPTPSPIWPPPIGGGPYVPPAIVQPTSSIFGVRCVATVNWKVEGNQVQRVFDIGSGVSISGTCQGVDVSVQDQTYSVFGPANVQYTVSAQVVRGTRPAISLPPILIATTGTTSLGASPVGPVVPLAGGESVDFTVPANCGINSVEITTWDDTTPETQPNFVLVQHFNGSTFATKQYSAALQTGYVKLAPNATDVRIINRGTDEVFVSVSWGIDG
jgi:hypothetical protein